MNVVHLSCVAPPKIGGIGRVASLEVESLQQRGIDATLVSPQSMPAQLSFGNAALLDLRRLREAVSSADVVHLHYPFYGTAEMIAHWRKKSIVKRLVMTLHMDATASGMKGVIFDLHRKYIQPSLLNAVDVLLVSSKDYAQHSSFAPWAQKAIELPFGVDEQFFSPDTSHKNGPTVLCVGGMDAAHAFKGMDVLIRAFAELPQNAQLILGGDGELRRSYETLAQELGVAARVTFLGRIAPQDLPSVYRSADVFAFPSTSAAEAFGLVALEAQSCGIPVVASDLPGVRTVIEDKVTGLLTPPGDAKELAAHLRLILENPGMREEFGMAARARVLEKFTWTKHIDGLMEVYHRICVSP